MRTKLVLGSAACVLSLLRAAPAAAAVTLDGKAPLPPLVYFDAAGELLRVDNRVLSAATASFLSSHDGCVEMPIERAIFSDGGGGAAPVSRRVGDVVHLGAAREDVRTLTGKDVDTVQLWDRVLTQRTCRSAAGMSVTLEVGGDRMSVLVPWDERVAGTVTINGRSSVVSSSSGYEELTANVRNPDELASGIVTLASVSSELGSRYTAPVVAPMGTSCFWPCFRCGTAAAGLIIGGTAALVATCGAAAASAGALTPACIAGGIAYFSGALAVADACLGCDQCLNPKPPAAGSGGSQSSGDPQQCPSGYHECCTNKCCSNDDPPPTCD